MLQFKRRGLILLVLSVLLILLVSGVGYTIAKFTKSEEMSINSQLHDFDVDFALRYVDGGGNEHIIRGADLEVSNGLLRLTVDEYDSLSVDTVYSGMGRCYYRFRIKESWQHINGGTVEMITPKALSTYVLGSGFVDNRSDDGFIYSGLMQGDSDSSVLTVHAVQRCSKGLDAKDLNDEADASTFVDLTFELDAVQWNRVQELWNLSAVQYERIYGG